MSHRLFNAPLLLLLWQVVPSPTQPAAAGRFRFSLASGTGSFIYRSYQPLNCAGDPDGPRRYVGLTYDAKGIAGEVRVSDRVTVHGATGKVIDESGGRGGWYGALQGILHRRWFATGGGVVSFGSDGRGVSPAGFVRLGREDRLHFRADYGFPTATMAFTGLPRVGVGLQGRSSSAFAGLTTTPIPRDRRRVGGFLDLGLPVKGGLGLVFHLLYAGTDGQGDHFSLGGGLSLSP